jgi:ornithine decarboxylase
MDRYIKIAKKSYNSVGVINFNHLKNIINSWNKYIPYIQPFYAVKSFPNLKLLKFLKEQKNIGFDCASKYEISLVKNFNRPIIYANPVKSGEDILYAKKYKVFDLVVDSVEECHKIKMTYPNANIIVRVVSNELFSQIKFNKKFGANIEELSCILDFIKNNKLKFLGYSFHVGSKCSNMVAYQNTINDILNFHFNYIGAPPQVIDIGGGFENIEQLIELSHYLYPIHKNMENIKLIAEPGRLFSHSVLDVYTKVIGVRQKNVDNIDTNYVTLNDSIYHTFNGKIFDGQNFEPIPLYENNITDRCILFGNTCDSLDMLADVNIPMPSINDIILFKNVGSYSLASSTGKFNGFSSCVLK